MSREGFPPTMEYSGKSLHSTQPPAMMLPLLIVCPGMMSTWHPIHTSSSMMVGFRSVLPCSIMGMSVRSYRWLRSRIVQSGPIMTLFPMVMLLGTLPLTPSPELSPMLMPTPVPNLAPCSMLIFLPQCLKICLQHHLRSCFPPSSRDGKCRANP